LTGSSGVGDAGGTGVTVAVGSGVGVGVASSDSMGRLHPNVAPSNAATTIGMTIRDLGIATLHSVQHFRQVAHELWQIRVAELLPDGVGLAHVEPVMVVVFTIKRNH
jgi:hypothetical protein